MRRYAEANLRKIVRGCGPVAAPRGGDWGDFPPISQRSLKLSKKNGIKLVGYTFRRKNYVKIPPTSFEFVRAGATTGANTEFAEKVP